MRAHEDGHPDPMVGTGNWTIRMRTRWHWQGRAPERETRELLGKVMRAAGKWTREPMRSWVTRRGGDWREGAEECLIRAERAWESDEEDVIRETGEALAKVRRALRTLVDIERQLNGCADWNKTLGHPVPRPYGFSIKNTTCQVAVS